jgi:hypothetical protein
VPAVAVIVGVAAAARVGMRNRCGNGKRLGGGLVVHKALKG